VSKKIILASGNKGKVKELAVLLSGLGIEVLPQSEFNLTEVAETGTTFGLPAIADDSGLAVHALGGEPGVYSARYSGDQSTDKSNIIKLLNAMADVPKDERQAKFLCVLVYMRHADDPTPIICQGEWCGEITTVQQGKNGFGYDPIFWVKEQNCSSAQLSPEQKNMLSHRGKALKLLLAQLQNQNQIG
jgi:XTP/dITP diphosphohydrolase